MDKNSRLPSVNAGPDESQVRKAKEVFQKGDGKSSFPSAQILYGSGSPRKQPSTVLPSGRTVEDTSSHSSHSVTGHSDSGLSPMVPSMQAPTTQKKAFALPSLSLGIGQQIQKKSVMMEKLKGDQVDYVHGVHSVAMPDIAQQGLRPVATRIQEFAAQQPIATKEQREAVAKQFQATMQSGERGNTLEAWVKDPQAPIATGISLYQAKNAPDANFYAKKGEADGHPVILGISPSVALQKKDVGHELSDGPIAPEQINKVYVPTGRSTAMNAQLEGTPLRGRAFSFSELFENK